MLPNQPRPPIDHGSSSALFLLSMQAFGHVIAMALILLFIGFLVRPHEWEV